MTLLLIVLITLFMYFLTLWIIRLLARKRGELDLKLLVGPASRMVLVVGLGAFMDALPLPKVADLWADRTLFVLGALAFAFLIHRVLVIALEFFTRRTRSTEVLQLGFFPMIRNLITLFVMASASIAILKRLGYDVVSLLTALGVGSLAVGLAAKETLSNMISGFTLLIDQNLVPGDRVQLAGVTGTVEQIGLRSTRIRTGQGSMLIVPNAELVNTRILNLSQPSESKAVTLQFRAPLQIHFSKLEQISIDALEGASEICKAKPRTARLSSIADGNQLVTLTFWVDSPDLEADATSQVNQKLLESFASKGINISAVPSN